jgi:large repetitive protein
LNYTARFSPGASDGESVRFDFDSLPDHGHGATFKVPDAHLLFSGDYQRSGSDLIISDHLHRVIVPDYFHGDKRPLLVSPEGAPLDAKVIDALTGYTHYAQAAGANVAGKVVGHVAKMTGSASIVRNGVTIVLNNGDAVYQTDLVQTGSNSTLGLVLVDGTTFNLTANARLMLNDLTYDPTSTSNTSLFTLVQGAASFVAGQVAKTGDMKVGTPVAAIGVRGTSVILDISSTDGTVSVSVVDQQDGQIHAVQVFNTRGDLIGTVSSNGTSLTLTPAANFQVIAQESNKSPAQIAQEFNVFQQVLSTYDAFKAIAPDTPPPSDGKRGDAAPQSTTKYATNSVNPIYSAPTSNTDILGNPKNTQTSTTDVAAVTSTTTTTQVATVSTSTPPTTDTFFIPEQQIAQIPFVVTPSTVTLISAGSGDHFNPVMSANGRFVTYDPVGSIYLFDRQSGTTSTIASPGGGFTYSAPSISADGDTVIYQGSNGTQSYIFVYGNNPADPVHYHQQTLIGPGTSAEISGDGSTIIAEEGGTSIAIFNQQGHVIGSITPAAVGISGTLWKPAISADGHLIAFWSSNSATAGGAGQLFAYNISTGTVTSIASTSVGAGITAASISSDGHYMTYQSETSGGHSEIYLYDTIAGQVVFHTANAGGSSYNPAISPDGHYIVFASDAQLTPDDTNSYADTYVVDVTNPSAPVYKLVSALADGTLGNAASNLGATISSGGLYVAFGTSASNFSAGSGGGGIFVVDPTAGHSAVIQETASSPSILSASGSIEIAGGVSGVALSVSDPSKFSAAFSPDGQSIVWSFNEAKSDFASLPYGQTASHVFNVTLSANGGTTTVPIMVTVENAVQPGFTPTDAPPVANPITLAAGLEDTSYLITQAALLNAVGDVDGPSLSITAVTIQSGGGTLVHNADQTWTYTPDPGFTGEVVFNYTASDTIKSANSTASLDIVLPLQIVSITPDSGTPGDFITNSTNLTVTGTNGSLAAGDTIQVSSDNGVTWADAVQMTTTTWSLVDPAAHSTSFTYQVRIVDSANNVVADNSHAVTIDTTAPSGSTPVLAAGSDSGVSSSDHITNVLAPTFTVALGATVAAGDTVQLLLGGSPLAHPVLHAVTAADISAGSVSLAVTAGDLGGDGGKAISAQFSDLAGNSSTTSALSMTLDTVAPVVTIGNGGGLTNQAAQTIGGSVDVADAGAAVTVLDGGTPVGTAIVQGDGSWSTGVTLNSGSNSLTAAVTDAAGNSGLSNTVFYALNTTAPTGGTPVLVAASDSGVSSADDITNMVAPTFTVALGATVAAGDTVQLLLGGAPLAHPVLHTVTAADVSAGSVGLAVTAGDLGSDGSKAISARFSDPFGNSSTTSALNVLLDTTAPSGSTPVLAAGSDSGVSSSDHITNVLAPTFTVALGATVAAGDTVQLLLGGSPLAHPVLHAVTAADISAGSVSLAVTAGDLGGDGGKAISAQFSDLAGNNSTTSALSMTLDTVAPAVTIGNGGGLTNQAAQTIGGSVDVADAGAAVTVLDGGTPVGTAIVQGDGSWSTAVTLNSGSNSLTAEVTDAAGNSGLSNTVTVTLATAAPSIAITSPVAGDNIINKTEAAAGVTISGTAVAGTGGAAVNGQTATITIVDSSNTVKDTYTATVTAGAWSVNITTAQAQALADGSYSIKANVSDAAGNAATTASQAIAVDETAPSIAITAPVAGDNIINKTEAAAGVTISGTATAGSAGVNGQTATITIVDSSNTVKDTHTTTVSGGAWSVNVTAAQAQALADGSYSIKANVSDAAGNAATTASLSVTLDTTAPSGGAPILTAASDSGTSHTDGITNVTAPVFTVALNSTAVAGDTVQLLLSGSALAHPVTHTITAADVTAGRVSLTVTAGDLGADGSKSITARFTDAAGNSSITSVLGLTLDTAAPAKPATAADAAVINGVVNAANDTASQALTGTAEAGSTVTVFDNGAQVGTTLAAANGGWSYVIGVLANGSSHSYTVTATDAAGNISAPSDPLAFTVNTTGPAEPLAITAVAGSSLANNTTVTVSGTNGTLPSGQKIQVSSDGGSTWTDAVRITGASWSFVDAVSHTGNFAYRARIIDTIGNSSAVATQAVIVASAGATVSLAGSPPFIAEFAGIGGNLALGSSAITSTVNAISIASGPVGIVGSANVTASTGDGIDLAANGGTQATPSNIGVAPTGAVTGAATGISVIQNGAGSIGIVTSSPVIGLAGRGIFAEESATGIGAIVISGSADVTGTGDAFSGIVAQNLDTADGSNVTVSETGNVTGGYDGIRAITSGSGNVIVTTGASATIAGRLRYGIEAVSNGIGSINVTMAAAAGDVITSGSVGINAYNQATAIPQISGVTSSTIAVTAYGTINSGDLLTGSSSRPAGILAGYRGGTTNTVNAAVYGNVTVDNFANINAVGGDGIRAYNFGNGNVTVTDHAGTTIVTKDQFGIDAQTNGTGQVTVTTATGDIITSGSYGIQAINLATSIPVAAASSVSVTAFGTIHAGFHLSPGAGPNQGISAGYYPNNGTSDTSVNGTVSIDNFANVTSDNGWGISAYDWGNGSVTLTDEAGTFVSGMQYGLNGFSGSLGAGSSGSVTINVLANATITAGAAINAAGINASERNAGNITITTASGDTINSGGFGINAGNQATSANSSSQISITARGTINSGFSGFSVAGINAGYNGGSGTVNTSVAGNVFVDDYAAINAASGPGINLYNFGTGNLSATVEAGATVAGATAALSAYAQGGGNVTIGNSGTVTAATGNGINVGTGTGNTGNGLPGNATGHGTISITNAGAVTGLGASNGGAVVQVDNFSANAATFNNSGTVTANMLSSGLSVAISVYSGTITSNTGGSTINNNSGGTISGNVALSPTILVSTSTFNNAAGATWNVNGNNWFGSATSAINNSGTINIAGNSGFYAALVGAALTFNNSGTVEILSGGYGHIGGAVTGGTASAHGLFLIDDRAALEFAGSVVSTQTVSFADGKGVLRLDNPATFAGTISGLAVGDIIDFAGIIAVSTAAIAGTTLTVTETNAATLGYTVANVASNASANLDVLSPDKIVVLPTASASMDVFTVNGLSNTTYVAAPPTKSTTYIFSNDSITGTTTGININAPAETTSTDTISALVNQTSSVLVSGASVNGIVAATGGASIAVDNAASVTAGGIGIFANNGASGNGSIDIVDYGGVSGVTAGIQALAAGTGPINILVGAGAIVTGATTSNTSTGILAISKLGSASVTTSGSTINSGRTGVFVENQSASVPLLNGVRTSIVVTTSGAINSGQGGTTSTTGVPAGIVAGYLGNATGEPSIPNPPLAGIFGDVVVNNNATITAATGMGIDAFNYGTGDVSVSNSSSITANAAGTTANGFTQYGIFAFNYGTGNTSVATASGSSIVSGGTGINAGNQATVIAAAASSTLTVDSLGTIHSGANLNNSGSAPAGILAGYNPGNLGVYNSGVSGNVLVIDGGNITADAGEGINAYNFGNGNVTVNVGFGVTITALTAASAGSKAPYGIGADARGPGNVSITTSSGDVINSGSSGINAVNESNPIVPEPSTMVTVNSFGTINFGGLATNSGGVPAGVSAGYLGGTAAAANMNVNGTVIVNNSANITATVFNGVAVSGVGINAFNYGNGDITVNDNSGTTVSGVQNGIDAHAEGGTGTNTPTGNVSVNVAANATVVSTTSHGILAFSTDVGNISVVTSSGDVITGGSAGINAVNEQANILPSANSWISVTTAGTINSGTALTGTNKEPAGILAGYLGGTAIPTNLPINVSGEVVVNNSANINAAGGDGIRAYNYGIGNVTVNQFAGTITALDASDLAPAGYGIGIAANNFGSGDIYINMTAGTINAGGSGISALNRAVSTAAFPAVPSTSIVLVLATGTINSGSITTDTTGAVKDPAAGILAGYDPNNSDTIDANVHGNVVVDDFASILAAAGTDGIRAVNYGTFDANGSGGTITVTVEAGAVISAGRYGVAALGFDGGNVTVTNDGTIMGTTDAVDAVTTSTGTVVLDNAGYLGGNVVSYNATFTNEVSATWSLNGQNVFTGASTLSNAGVIDSNGTSVISGLSGITNTGLIEVLSGSLVLGEPVTGAGTAIVYSATLEFGGASDANVQFATSTTATSGSLVLDDVAHFAGTVTGFTFGDTIDLVGIDPANVRITNAGSLLVDYRTGSFGLIGNYDPTGFSIVTDGHAGTDIIWNHHQTPVISTNSLAVTQNGNGTTTITGLQVSDSDAAASSETFTITATTGAASSGTSASPSSGSGLLTVINTELGTGVTYNPGATPPSTDKVALTVTDGFGATDTVNFVFNLASSPTAPVTLTGTSGKDVIFATGNNDTLTGGGGADQFVFNKTTGAHTITDFSTINDHIDLTALSSVVTAPTLNAWLATHVNASTASPADTVISLGGSETITLHNVLAANVTASDFIVHA